MPTLVEETHKFCEICGSPMGRVTHCNRSKYCRKTGVEKPGDSWQTWECPNYAKDRNHDKEVLS